MNARVFGQVLALSGPAADVEVRVLTDHEKKAPVLRTGA
jgi:hypothetical protein